jgi:beta-glucosidase
MYAFRFPDDFQLGVSSAATQIEGGDTNNNWYAWACGGHIKDGTSPVVANDHYRRWKEDLDLMVAMGIRNNRFGLEWSRIEPKEGCFDEEALAHYRTEIQAMVDAGIRPLLTLHHFSNPIWFEEMGAFENPACLNIFLRFTDKIVRTLGDLVSEYITINEPNVYAMNGYMGVGFPPGKNSLASYRTVLTNMVACHIEAYQLIHRLRREMGHEDTKVSFAVHMRAFQPLNRRNPWHVFCTRFAETSFQTGLIRGMALGKLSFPLRRHDAIRPGQWCDFWGVNYYSRSTVSGMQDGVMPGRPVTDLGWEIYPQGIAEVCRKVYDVLPRPIYITENGTCDNHDSFRGHYLYDHLYALLHAGLPVQRYYHWCFCDNFEWLEGESARFGLVHVDYRTQKRTIKASGDFFSAMIRDHGISEELYQRYCTAAYHH